MSASIVLLRPDGQRLTGTGTVNVQEARVAGYVNTDGSSDATVVLRDTDENGGVIFDWDSPVATSFWPTVCESKKVWYSVTGTGAFVVLHSVVV